MPDKELKKKKCKVCKTTFPVYNSLQKYCSPECSYKAQKKRAKKKRRENDNTALKKKVTSLLRKCCVMRDKGLDQKDFTPVSGRNAQMSHVRSKGAYPSLKFELDNVKLLSYKNHIHWWHKEPADAIEWFKSTFPERWKRIEELRMNPPKVNEEYLLRKKAEYEQYIKLNKDKNV